MKQYLCLLDENARFVFLSGSIEGTDKEQFIGCQPWDWVPPDDVNRTRENVLEVYQSKSSHSWGQTWRHPEDDSINCFYYQVTHWIGLKEVAASMRVWEFPVELSFLSDREIEVFYSIGEGKGVGYTASKCGIKETTVYGHLARIAEATGMIDSSDVIRLAILFREAVTQ